MKLVILPLAGESAFRRDLGSSAGDSWLRRVVHDHFKPFDEGPGFCTGQPPRRINYPKIHWRKAPFFENRRHFTRYNLDRLLGLDLYGRTAGVIGTGKIGAVVARILKGLDCHLLAYDPFPNPDCERLGVTYVTRPHLFADSDIVMLACVRTTSWRSRAVVQGARTPY